MDPFIILEVFWGPYVTHQMHMRNLVKTQKKRMVFAIFLHVDQLKIWLQNRQKTDLKLNGFLGWFLKGSWDPFSTIFGVPNPSMLHPFLHVIFMLIFKESLESQTSWEPSQEVVKCTLGGATTSYQTTSFPIKYLEFSQTCCCTLHRLRRLDKLQAHRLRKLHNLQIYMTCNQDLLPTGLITLILSAWWPRRGRRTSARDEPVFKF